MSYEKRIRFTYDKGGRMGYRCSEPGDQDGEYVKVPADDSEPITEAWLRSIGAQPDRMGWLTIGPIHIQPEPGTAACVRSLPIPRPATRGDVRRLCSALGITLTEAGQ